MRQTFRLPGSFLLAALLLFAGPARADDFKLRDAIQEFGEKRFIETTPGHNLRTGPLRIYPRIDTRTAFDDNILRERNDAKQDVVFNIKPGAIVELPLGRHQIAAGYEADFEIFTKPGDGHEKAQNQNFFSLADFNFNSAYLNVLEELTSTSDRSGTTFTSRIPRLDESINPKAGVRWKRWTFENGFRLFNRDFRRKDDNPFDFTLWEYSPVIFYDLFARLKALVDYTLAQIDYPHSPGRQGHFHQFRLGLEGEPMPNLFVNLRGGMQLRNYDSTDRHDFDSWVAKLYVTYQIRENFQFKGFFTREPVEATFSNVNFYVQSVGQIGFDYTLARRWVLFTEAQYARHRYGERAQVNDQFGYRRDQLIATRNGVRWIVNPSLQLELSHELFYRHSNFSFFDYVENVYSLRTRLSY